MNRTPGSWLLREGGYWIIRFKYEDETGRVDDRQTERQGTKKKVEKEYLELATDFGRASLLKRLDLPGRIVEVIGLFRERSMLEQILVKGADFEKPRHSMS